MGQTRTVIEDYWYTDMQVTDVGNNWARQSPESRLFCIGENINKTGLKIELIPESAPIPYQMLLPLNIQGKHWTAITVDIKKIDDDKTGIKISFTDSLSSSNNIPKTLNAEIDRIEKLLLKKYKEATVTKEFYEHTWKQPDGSSCGPYSLKNAERCLAGRGHEENAGRVAIREEQLGIMKSPNAIRGCSTNNYIDEILISWIIQNANYRADHVTLPHEINSAERVEQILEQYFANMISQELSDIIKKHIPDDENSSNNLRLQEKISYIICQEDVEERDKNHIEKYLKLRKVFTDEFSILESGDLRPYPVQMRIRELLTRNETVIDAITPNQQDFLLRKIISNKYNIDDEMKTLHNKIHEEVKDRTKSYKLTANVIEHLCKLNIEEAVILLTSILPEGSEALDKSLLIIANAAGNRFLQEEYISYLATLAEKYKKFTNDDKKLINNINLQLAALKTEAAKLPQNSDTAKAATALNQALTLALENLIKDNSDNGLQEFKNNCASKINAARSVLERNDRTKKILGNITLAVIGLLVFYGLAVAINKKMTGNFLFFKDPSIKIIDEISKELNNTVSK